MGEGEVVDEKGGWGGGGGELAEQSCCNLSHLRSFSYFTQIKQKIQGNGETNGFRNGYFFS